MSWNIATTCEWSESSRAPAERLQTLSPMLLDDHSTFDMLSYVFTVLRRRDRGIASFRRFVVLVATRVDANILLGDLAPTQPLRVLSRRSA
jgi:hypothetical protein